MGLMRLHGGTLHIESQPGSGTTVILNLPGHGATPRTAKTLQGRAA
jgi:signal transduction histidine kinase